MKMKLRAILFLYIYYNLKYVESQVKNGIWKWYYGYIEYTKKKEGRQGIGSARWVG
jgi:hypothetical protein